MRSRDQEVRLTRQVVAMVTGRRRALMRPSNSLDESADVLMLFLLQTALCIPAPTLLFYSFYFSFLFLLKLLLSGMNF